MTQLHGIIDHYGESKVRADLAHLFNVSLDDVLYGCVSVRHALMLLGQAPEYADSMIRKEALGSRELAQWSVTTSALAHLNDLLASLLSGLSKTPLDQLRFKRPDADTKPEPQLFAKSIKDFNVDRFLNKFSG